MIRIKPVSVAVASCALWTGVAATQGALLNLGGTGVVVFGVAPIGGPPNPGGPVFIHNNLTDRFDILSSPGNGWLTADTSLTNNIQENGGPLPGFAFRVGGGNVNGPFGAGVATIDAFGNVGFAISDAAPAGGSGSYLIASSITQYQSVGNTVGAVTAALGIAGRLASPLSSLAVSLRIEILDTANVFLGVNSPPQVLAVGGGLNDVALGDFWATQFNPLTGDFLGLSIDTTPVLNIPNGDILTVRTTLTAIGDPSTISSLGLDDPLLAPLLAQSGATIGDLVLSQSVGAPPIPAPATAAIVATLFAGALRRRRAA